VYRSFFVRIRDGQFDLTTWGDLRSLLAVITRRKCINHAARYRGQGRNLAREVALERGSPDLSEVPQPLDQAPTPIEGAILAETVETLLAGLETTDRTIVECALQGDTCAEISARVGLSERTVRRVLERIKRRLVRMRDDERHQDHED
jgi:RNA polymerase sigma-70 factor (ECF subfamily)